MAIGTLTKTENDGVFRFKLTTLNLSLSGLLQPNPAFQDDGMMKKSHVGKVRGPHGEVVEVMGGARNTIQAESAENRGEAMFNLWFTDPDLPNWRMVAWPRRDDAGALFWEINVDRDRRPAAPEGEAS